MLAQNSRSGAGDIYRNFASKFPSPKQGELRIWWIPQVPGKPFEWPVADLVQAALMLDALAAYDDFQYSENVKGDYANCGGLWIWNEAEADWVDWEDDECDDFDTWREKQKAAA